MSNYIRDLSLDTAIPQRPEDATPPDPPKRQRVLVTYNDFTH